MADEKQLEILKQGAEVWNVWRKTDAGRKIHIDLKNITFKKVDLSGFDLEGANLSNTELRGANLSGVNLRNACFVDANVSGSDLTNADLSKASFTRSKFDSIKLDGAKLVDVNLCDTKFSRASLVGCNLEGANMGRADFWKANLKDANLRNANLISTDLREVDFRNADLSGANLKGARMTGANLEGANLSGAKLNSVNLGGINLSGANLKHADLSETDLGRANLVNADLSNANLSGANLVGAKVSGAKITGSSIYAVNVWDLNGEFMEQKDLAITPVGAPIVTVDNIKVAQFIYLILNNAEIRDAINTLTSKSVLILGRFALPERKSILDALRNKLREFDLLPIVFDFDRPIDKDFTETIKTLAGLSYFVIADVTNPKSSPLELQATVPDYQIPFVPIIQEGESPFAMMVDLQKKYDWVLKTVAYDSLETLIGVLKPLIIDPAMKKREELRLIKAQVPDVISAKDFLNKAKE